MQQRFITIYPDNTIAVCTIGPKGDGSDNIVETFINSTITMDYNQLTIEADDLLTIARYPSKEIVFITTKEVEND